MGAAFCCLRVDEFEDYVNPNNAIDSNCFSLRSFLSAYTTIFQRGEVQGIPSSIQETSSLTSTGTDDNSFADTYHSPPRPLPYDSDPRCFRSQWDGLVSSHDKGSTHVHDQSEPLQKNNIDSCLESSSAGDKWSGSKGRGSEESELESSVKHPLATFSSAFGYLYSSPEDEDVCPTCLEEYTSENPKIMTKCLHHFHLVCIYEWMERSESCPVCGKVMEFDEMT